MKLSKLTECIEQSLTRKLFDAAKNYDNVIDFTLGDPDYQTPQNIKEAGCKAIMDGKTRYSANAGILPLREAIAESIFKETGVRYNYDEVIVTLGAMEALYLSLCCLIDSGDEVIITAPYWINYKHMIQMCGGVPVILDTKEENDFILDIDCIRSSISSKTAAIIINSPNNPTGTIYDEKTLNEICRLAKENNFVVVWDECYKSIVYDGAKVTSVLEFDGMKEYAVIINSCSKKYAMTGWRLGYAAAPAKLIENMAKFQENIAACAALPSQYAAIEAFKGDDSETERMRKGFEKRRNILIGNINKIDKLSCKYSKGTFYALVNIKKTGMGSEEFAYKLLERKQVAVVPGITYGQCCEGYIRLAYTMDEDKIIQGVNRIKEFVDEM